MLTVTDSSSEGDTPLVEVCVCTFRRTSLTDTLRSIARQIGVPGRVAVMVADNDDAPSAVGRVEALRAEGLEITYLHAPARNISIARNACLDRAGAPWIAFIDDDEIAAPDWLASLFTAAEDSSLSAVFGPVHAIYPKTAPHWAELADLHSTRPVETRRGIDTGYTSNALVRREAIGAMRFDRTLGTSGGEDTDLFSRLYAHGARYGYAADAIVTEMVAPTRLSLLWLARRAFRSGQTHARRYLGSPGSRIRAGVVAFAKALACLGLVILSAGSAAGWRRGVVRGAVHLGATARLLGVPEPRLYG